MAKLAVESLIECALRAGAHAAAVVRVDQMTFCRDFRSACVQNTCGKYGTCWMCPPDIGEIDDLIAMAKTYEYMLVFQSVGQLEDSFDIEGMEEAAVAHNALALKLAEMLDGELNAPLRLGAGACHVCARCAREDDLPCRCPDFAVASLEAYGIAVSELATQSGLAYHNGPGTVTYFGGFLFQ